MSYSLVLVIAALMSVAAFAVGALGLRLPVSRLGSAVGLTLEAVGATVVFFAANLLAGMAVVLALRRLTPIYLTLYEMSDIALLALSLLQAVTFAAWRRTRC